MKIRTGVKKVIILLTILAIWQIVSSLGIYPKVLFPGLPEIFNKVINDLLNKNLLNQIVYSFYILIKALFISIVGSFILVILGELSDWFDSFVELILTIAHPLPGIAIIPLVILWIGIGSNAILFIIIHSMIWPMVINLKTGIYSVSKTTFDVGTVFNFTFFQKLKHIYFMGLFPHLLSGAKIAWSRGWRALISSEMVFAVLGSSSGLGWYIFEKRVYMDTSGLYGGLFVIVVLGFLVEKVFFEYIEKKTIKKWLI